MCLAVWLGFVVPPLTKAITSLRPETLDSPAVGKQHKMILKWFKITEIYCSVNLVEISEQRRSKGIDMRKDELPVQRALVRRV